VETLGLGLLAVLAAVPWAAGWVAGALVRLGLWMAACVVAGYEAGRGQQR